MGTTSSGRAHTSGVAVLAVCLAVSGLAQGQDGRKKPVDELAAELESPESDHGTRVVAAQGLADLQALGVPSLARALAHADPEVRGCAAVALGKLGPLAAPAQDALFAVALHDPDLDVSFQAMCALVELGEEPTDRLFTFALEARRMDPSETPHLLLDRGLRAEWALFSGDSAVLLERMRADDPLSLVLAAELLAGDSGPEFVAALQQALEDPDRGVRLSAIQALGSLGTSRKAGATVDALVEFVEGEDEGLALAAIDSLATIGGPAAEAALIRALRSKSGVVCEGAASGLGRLGGPTSLAALTQALDDPKRRVRAAAVWGLCELGAAAEPSLHALAALPLDESLRALKYVGKQLKRNGTVLWWIPLRVYWPQLAGLLALLVVWFVATRRLLPRVGHKIRGLRLIAISSVLSTATACSIGYMFLPRTAWWNDPTVLLFVVLAVFLVVFLSAGKLLRSPSPSVERVAWIGLVATAPVALAGCGVHYVLTQDWVEGYLPDSLFLVLPLPIAAMVSVAFCCVLLAIWVCTGQAIGTAPDNSPPSERQDEIQRPR